LQDLELNVLSQGAAVADGIENFLQPGTWESPKSCETLEARYAGNGEFSILAGAREQERLYELRTS
jgi:hypothetical protein